MKMHKKLITLLATAAVGLTLTSCGGGGGGGAPADNTPDTGDTPSAEMGAPVALIGRTLTLMMQQEDMSYNTYNLVFSGSSTITGNAKYRDGVEGDIVNGTYTYKRDSSSQGRFIHLRFGINWEDGDSNNDIDWSGLELYFDESGNVTGTNWNKVSVVELN